MIRHAVVFNLKHATGSLQEKAFLRDARAALEGIPGVENLEVLRQTNGKADYRFAITMEFADRAAFEGYNKHPKHAKFVKERWEREVSGFLEVDYEPL
jgi:heme-degrading monooxygenase HmoA